MTKRSLNGKLVFITGAARGIGRATAKALVDEGARVVLSDLDGDLAQRTAAELGHGTVGIQLDVTDHAAFSTALDRVEADHGPLDILINNAGIMAAVPFVDETPESRNRQIAVNFLAPWHATQDGIRRMRPRGRGHILNVASLGGVVAMPGAATYSATKHAVVGLTETVSWEIRGSGIDLGCVLPAMVNTELADGMKRTRAAAAIEPEEVAQLIIKALREPKRMIYAPARMSAVMRWSNLIPGWLGDKLMLASGSDHLISDALASGKREAYEQRVARSAPGTEN